jgi:hypothetical protein
LDEEDEDEDEDVYIGDEAWVEQWREAKPSNDPWLVFETTVSIAELDSKTGPVSVAIVDGREAAFTDRVPLAVAARLAWPDVVIRLTHDSVSIFDTELRAFVATRPRVS